MKTTLIAVTFRSPETDVDRLIDSFRSAFTAEEEIEVIVIQNDMNPPYRRENITLLYGHGNVGFGAGVNLGVKNATGSVLLIANPDSYFIGVGARSLVQAVVSEKSVDIIAAPLIRTEDGQVEYHPYGDWTFTPTRYLLRAWSWLVLKYRKEHTIPRGLKLPGTALVMSTKTARSLGPFDPIFFLYGEDRDLCRRARDADVKLVLCKNLTLIHQGGVSAKAVPEIVLAGQASAALEIAHRKYGSFGYWLCALDLLLTSRNRTVLKIRTAEVRRSSRGLRL